MDVCGGENADRSNAFFNVGYRSSGGTPTAAAAATAEPEVDWAS